MESGVIFNIQRYSIDDGPGIRTTVFLKGCPLTCLWCSNPESQKLAPEVSYRFTACRRCGKCVQNCPSGAATLDGDGVHIDRTLCKVCGKCVEGCLPEALSISGKRMTTDEVMKVVIRDKDYYESSNGGVTASGGEILMQPAFVAEIFERCRTEGIHTCADTSGYGTLDAMLQVCEHCDLLYFDLKHMDASEHKRLTGTHNEAIIQNLTAAAKKNIPIVIRFPLIPSLNDSDQNIAALADTVHDLGADIEVHILPYHRYGASKYRTIDRIYPLEGLEPPTPEAVQKAREIIESRGLRVVVSG